MTSPRSSPLLTWSDCREVAECGGKALGLARAAEVASVPWFLVVPGAWFEAACAPWAPLIERACAELTEPDGAQLAAVHDRIAALFNEIMLTPDMRVALGAALNATKKTIGTAGTAARFAVRSSASSEDGDRFAEAGLYDSFLDVRADEVERAVARCWASAFSPSALRHRFLTRDTTPPRMAVVVQRMAHARQAGVAFSAGADTVVVERVDGLADGLVAGRVGPSGGDTVVLTGASPDCEPPLRQLRDTVRLLRHALGANADVDIEWVWDGDQVYVVQSRKVTASLPLAVIPTEPTDGPVLRVARIYGDGADVVGLDLGDVTELYSSYRRKRLALVEVAVRHDCGAGAAIVLRYNRAGLATAPWSELLVALGERVVVDVSADARQIIVPVDQLTLTLLEQLGHSGDDPRTVLVREFTTGEVGAICRLADGVLHVEWSADGLLAINRGLATELRRFVERDGGVTGPLPPGWDHGTVRRLRAVTEEFNTRGSCVIEWVASGTRLRAIDYSVTDADFEFDVLERATTISGGACQGPALVVDDALLGDLEATSVAPIVSVSAALPADGGSHIAELHARVMASGKRPVVVVDRPFAILAVLIGSVAGFVFRRQASLLCHLAILLREHAVPAIAVPGFEVEEGRLLSLLGNGEFRVEAPNA